VAIVFRCECGKQFETRDEDAGRRARCPDCQRELIVPQPNPYAASEFASVHEVPPTSTSGKAIASFVLGLCSFVMCLFTGVPALVLGIFALNDINNPKKRVTGKGFAITGIVIGTLTTLLIPIPVLIALLLPAVQAAREAARRAQCTNNLKQIGLAMHNYHSVNGTFPPAAICDASGKPLLSWRVAILPYLEQESLYNQFHLNEPWDSPHNKLLIAQIPPTFRCPSESNVQDASTTYEVIVDPRSMFTGDPLGVELKTVTDGTSNTLLVVEAGTPVSWSQPEDLSLSSRAPMLGMGSKHPGGLNALMADGSVRFIKGSVNNPMSPATLKAMVTRDGGDVYSMP
jgi:prepilin-type processing-associated H-X9-DG protein